MSALTNYIGIRGYHTSPASGRFINELPGVSLRDMQRIVNEEQITFVNLWNDIQSRAWMRLTTDLRMKLRDRFNIKSSRGLVQIHSTESTETVPVGNKYRGIVVNSGIDHNGFFAYYITNVYVKLPAAASNLTVKLFDRHGQGLSTYNIASAVEGSNAIAVNAAFGTPYLFIAVDATSIELEHSTIHTNALDCFCDVIYREFGRLAVPILYGAESDIATPSITGKTNISYGVSADIMATCEYTSIIAYQKEIFTPAWMYLLGVELMTERMFSVRKNELTTVNADEAEALRDAYTAQYEQALSDIVAGLTVHDDACIECREPVKGVERIP